MWLAKKFLFLNRARRDLDKNSFESKDQNALYYSKYWQFVRTTNMAVLTYCYDELEKLTIIKILLAE
jgi:hypothetical protein